MDEKLRPFRPGSASAPYWYRLQQAYPRAFAVLIVLVLVLISLALVLLAVLIAASVDFV